MRILKSQQLDLDSVIKFSVHPYQLSKFDKAVVQINHNPAILNKSSLLTAISTSLEFTNLYPSIQTTKSSFASFQLRKGMQVSLLTTVRKSLLRDLYYKFIFQLYPIHLNSIDTSILSNIFNTIPISGNYHIGINIGNKVSGNIIITLTGNNSRIKQFRLSYWSFAIKS